MSDDDYAKKLQSMQQYIPFLEVMIKQLKDPKKKNREQQLQKMESLYAMITDTKRKLKYETLVKCEDVIKKIQEKVNPSSSALKPSGMQKFVCKDPPEKPLVNIEKMRDEKFKLELARSKLQDLTPASPSPPRDIPGVPPIIVPTERVERRERPNIYTAAGATLLAKDTERRLHLKDTSGSLPDMSKPPLSKEDLKLLEMADVTETDVNEKSLDELESIRQKLYRELDQTKDSQVVAKPKETIDTTTSKTPTKKVEKVIKEPDSIFGNVLSSLDGKIIETTKKDKKAVKKDHKSDRDGGKEPKKSGDAAKERTHHDKGDSKETPKHSERHKSKEPKQRVKETQETKPDGVVVESKKEPSDGSSKKTGDSSSGVVYKRLADKYNPKPRKHSIEEDVAKQIEEQIQSAKPPVIEVLPQLPQLPQQSPLSPTSSCVKRFQPEPEVAESRPNWFDPPARLQEQQELIKMHNPIPVINQLCNTTPQIRINTNPNPVGNLTPMDPFLSSPTGFMSPTQMFQNQMLPIQPNQMIQNQPMIPQNQPMIPQNQQMLPQNQQMLPQNQVLHKNQPPIMNQGFVPPQNQFVARNQMMAHSTNIGGNTFVNNFIMQPQPFFQQQPKKSFNPYEPIGGGETSQSDNFEPAQNDFQRFERGNARVNYNQNRTNFTRPRMQNRFGDTDERPYHLDRDPRRQPRDNRDPRLASTRRSIEYETKFDLTYSKLDQKDTFVSPLDSLYNNTSGEVHGKGYGVQKFKIPKIKKQENVKEVKCEVVPTKVAAVASSDKEVDVDTNKEEVKEKFEETPRDELQENSTKPDELPKETKPEDKEQGEEKKEVKEDKKLATEEDLIKELVKGIIDRAPDQKEVLYSIINTLTSKKKKKKFKKIRPVIESDSDSSSSSDGDSDDSSDKESEAKETRPKSKKATKGTPSPNKDEPPKKTKPKVGRVEEKSPKVDIEGESTPPSTRLRSRQLSAKKSDEKEPPQESVGERIKNRKRQVAHAQTTTKTIQRRHKTELDLLHEDIKEMFIRDGVLTATGKRMCRILKDNPEALKATQKSPQTGDRRTSFEADDELPLVARLRKPKTDTIDGTESPKTHAAKTNLCVLLEKSINIEELSKKTLELEDRSKKSLDTSIETDEKSSEIVDTTTETDTTFDSDATKNRSPKTTNKKKKPKSSWYTGTIKKKKKKVRALSETPSSANSPIPHDDTSSVASEQEVTPVVNAEPPTTTQDKNATNHHHKDYYWKPDDKMDCKLCQFKGKLIVLHYKTVHNQSEVFVSRLKPEACEEALKNTTEPFDSDPHENPRHRYIYECTFCGATFKNCTAESFHDHVASHTGEYRYHCFFCRFQSSSCKSLRTHLNSAHSTTITNKNNILEPTHTIPHGRRYVYGHMCSECHYVQMRLSSIEEHIKTYHSEISDEVKIVKINMSRTLPELPVSVTKKKEGDAGSDKNETLAKDSEGVDETKDNDAKEVQEKPSVVRKRPGPKPKKKVIVLKKPPPKKAEGETTPNVSDGDKSDVATLSDDKSEVATISDGEISSKSTSNGDDVPQNDDELMEEEEKITSTVTNETHVNSSVDEKTTIANSDAIEIPPSNSDGDENVANNTEFGDEKTATDASVGVEPAAITTTTKKDGGTETTKDSSVFTTDTDLNEDNQQIEKERMEKMQAIYDSIKRHQSSFIEQLKSKLDNHKNEPQAPPINNREQESEVTSTVTELCKKAQVRVIDHDEVASSGGDLDNPQQDGAQAHKKMVPITGTIERLQEQLTAAPKLSPFAESNSLMPPPLTPVKDFELDTSVDLIQSGPVVIRKLNHTTEYLCFVPGCTFVSYTELAFESHLRQEHGDYSDHDGKCTICNKTIGDGEVLAGISELFAHVISDHLKEYPKGPVENPDDFGGGSTSASEFSGGFDQNLEYLDGDFDKEAKVAVEDTKKVEVVPLLRTRRMSGDILSSDTKKCIKQEVVDDADGDVKIEELKTEGDGDNEGLIIPSEESFFPFAIKSVETEDEFTMPIISNVVSLADDASDGYKNESQLPPPPPLRPLPNSQFIRLDSLTTSGAQINLMITPDSTNKSNLLILNQLPKVNVPQSPVKRNIQQSPPGATKKVLLKEFPMTAEDFKTPKKSQEAMVAMCMHSHLINLYKCPVFDCTFTTNGRLAFENHLTTNHEDERNQLMPCVYCNFKTEYSHIVIHHDVRHGGCLYACCYCVYRGVCQGYVEVHQNEMHQKKRKRILFLPIHKDSMSSKGRMAQPRLKDLIQPYRCGQRGCTRVFLATTDFVRHLKTHFVIEYSCSICSYKSSTIDRLLRHQSEMHAMFYYNCAYCKMGANHLNFVFRHQALHHFGNSPDIVMRAFKKRKVVTGAVVPDQDYEDLCHNRTDMKQTNALVPISKILPKPKGTTATSATSAANETTNIDVVSKEPSMSIDDLIRETLSDEPLLEILQKIPNSEGTPQEEDPLRLDVDTTTESTGTSETPTTPIPHVVIPTNFAYLDETDSQDAVDLERTVDEPDEPVESAGDAESFLCGHDLYKCTACSGTFPSSAVFKSHLNKCPSIANSKDPRPYNCPHCVKTFKNASTLTEHIRIHGVGKFKCSLCDYEHPYLYQVRYHMKSRHKIASTVVTPLVQNKTDMDKDDFVVRPKVFKRKSIDGGSVSVKEQPDETKADVGKMSKLSYGPGEIDQLPRQPIYHCQVTCSVCGYATKVRTNLVRHLEFHLKEKEVPSTAPVNPVPCLEKNEKMFDKMTNLAISSMGSGRMGGKSGESDKVLLTKEEEALLPAFVPSTKRFVCGITSCNYLCHEESRLRHHLLALHMDETTYTCTHCKEVLKWDKGNVNIDHVMKHMRLHDLNLYKCPYCNFYHNLKHKVERHVGDKHLDKKLQVIVVREMNGDSDNLVVSSEKDLTALAKEAKAWKCGMCKYRSATQDDMKTHCVHKHEIDSQFKCALCTYKSNTKETFTGHFEDEHKGNGVDIIDVFFNTNEITTKNDTEVDLFDTTPLWQRDRPRVRHIRGILLDDGRKSKKSKIMSETETNTTIEELKQKPSKTPIKKEPPPDLLSELNSAIREITQAIVDVDEDTPTLPPPRKKRKVSLKKVKTEEPPPEKNLMGTYGPYGAPLNNMFLCPLCNKFNTRFESDITNHLYQELEYFRYKCGLCDTISITFTFLCEHTKNKHSDTNPKNIIGLPKNGQIELWVQEVLKVQKQQIDEGPRGSADLNKESQTFVEYETVVLGADDEEDDVIIDELPPKEEKLAETATTSSMSTNVASPELKKLQSCPHCPYQCKNVGDLRKHEKRHWATKPFKCAYCPAEGVSSSEIVQHSKKAHRDQPPEVITQEMPDEPLIIPLVRRRKSKKPPTVAPSPPIKKVAVEKEPPKEKKFVCKYCPKRGETVDDLRKHWEVTHKNYTFEYKVREGFTANEDKEKDKEMPAKCIFCSFYGTVDEMKQHYDTSHADSKQNLHYKCSDCDEYFFRIDMLKGHFYEKHPGKTFSVANCRNKKWKYERKPSPAAVVVAADEEKVEERKKYKCANPDCTHTSNSYKAIMAHLRSHAKPYKCAYCHVCCNYPSFILKHQQFSHAGMEFKYETIDESFKVNQNLRRQLLVLNDSGEYEVLKPEKRKRATAAPKTGDTVDDLLVIHKVVYTARKKTAPVSRPRLKATARKSTTFVPHEEPGFSYYGQKPEELDLKKLTTKISIGGNDIVTTIEQFSHISNLFPKLLVEDCQKKSKEET